VAGDARTSHQLQVRAVADDSRAPRAAVGNMAHTGQTGVRAGSSSLRFRHQATEYKLLSYMIRNREAVLSRNELLDEVWGYNAMPSTRTVDVHVAGLRQKLEPTPRCPRYILTLHGLGYKFIG
jgi:DNA-binding response OmpR family regulator